MSFFTRVLATFICLGISTSPTVAKPQLTGTNSANGQWTPLAPSAFAHGVYDPIRDRVIAFGGGDSNGRNDTWALSLSGSPSWEFLNTTGPLPPPRYRNSIVYDSLRDRIIIFGGYSNTGPMNDAWALTLTGVPTWSELIAPDPLPAARYSHAAIYDPVGDRMVIFGGALINGQADDVWVLSLPGAPSWSQLLPGGQPPGPLSGHSATYDPIRNRMIIIGGRIFPWNWGGAWALSLAGTPSWESLGWPCYARADHSAIYDPVRDRVVIFGGSFDRDGNRHDDWNDICALSLAGYQWSAISPTEPLPHARSSHQAVYRPGSDEMVIFGGGYYEYPNSYYTNDVWALPLAEPASWINELFADPFPRRSNFSMIRDPVKNRTLIVGGSMRNDTWAKSLSNTSTWTQLAPSGVLPDPRGEHTTIWDPKRIRALLFGGYWNYSCYDCYGYYGDTWQLSLSGAPSWGELASGPQLADHASIYDPVRDQMVVYGGRYGSTTAALSLSGTPTWNYLNTAAFPPGRSAHSAIYDPLADRMIVFGGTNAGGSLNDTWELSLADSNWIELPVGGLRPSARAWHVAVQDPVRNRMVVFGGGDAGAPLADTWALSLSGSPTWTELSPSGVPPVSSASYKGFYDPIQDRMVIFDGKDAMWALTWGTPGDQFAVVSATTNKSLYQNGTDAVQFTIVTRNEWNPRREIHLSLDLEPSLGPTMHAGDDHFTLSPGEEHVSHITWPVPDSSYAWESVGHVTLNDGVAATYRRFPGWFSATPLSVPTISQHQQQVEACLSLSHDDECKIRTLTGYLPIFGTLASLGLATNDICKMHGLVERGATGPATGAFWAITPSLVKDLILEVLNLVTIATPVGGAVAVASILHTTGELARDCWRGKAADLLRALPFARAASSRSSVSYGSSVVDSLATWTMTGVDSTEAQLADGLFIGGHCYVRVEADGSWADQDSVGLVFATVENVDTLGVVALTTPRVFGFHGNEADNPNSASTFRIESRANQSVGVGLVHYRQDGGHDFLRYSTFTATNLTVMTLPVTVNETKFPMFVDLNGDGKNDEIHYPDGTVVSVRNSGTRSLGLRLWPARPNPFGGTTTLAFSIPDAGRARLEIYDVAGRLVTRIVDRVVTGNDMHEATWDGRSTTGAKVASGVYFCRLRTDQRVVTQRLVLLR